MRTAPSRNPQHFSEKLRKILAAWHNRAVAIQAVSKELINPVKEMQAAPDRTLD